MPTQNLKSQTKTIFNSLGIVGIILAVILPPLGLVWCLVLLLVIKLKNRPVGVKRAWSGIIVGVLLLAPFFYIGLPIYDVISGGTLFPNPAKARLAPLNQAIQAIGGKQIYAWGCDGRCLDSDNPFYDEEYSVPNTPSLKQKIEIAAKKDGYTLNDYFYNDNTYEDVDGESVSVNDVAQHLASSEQVTTDVNGKESGLTVAIYSGDLGLKAATSGDNLKIPSGDLVVELDLTLNP